MCKLRQPKKQESPNLVIPDGNVMDVKSEQYKRKHLPPRLLISDGNVMDVKALQLLKHKSP